jgi:hypothetical protein
MMDACRNSSSGALYQEEQGLFAGGTTILPAMLQIKARVTVGILRPSDSNAIKGGGSTAA